MDVAYVSHKYCKCIFQTFHMLQTGVAFKCFMLLVFRVSEVCSKSLGGTTGRWGKGRSEPGLAEGARDTPDVLRTGHACPHPGSRVSPAWRERRDQGEGAVGAGRGETDTSGVSVRSGTRQMGNDCSDTVGV